MLTSRPFSARGRHRVMMAVEGVEGLWWSGGTRGGSKGRGLGVGMWGGGGVEAPSQSNKGVSNNSALRKNGWCHMKCCRLSASSVYTIQPCTSLQCHFIQSHTDRVHVCLVVTCHLHFWQNDRDFLRATAVTRGWNGYRNKSAQKHRVDVCDGLYKTVPLQASQPHLQLSKCQPAVRLQKFVTAKRQLLVRPLTSLVVEELHLPTTETPPR